MADITLSVGVTAHHEGLLLHKTLRNIMECIKYLGNDISTEIIINVDNGNEETISYLRQYSGTNMRIFYNTFGDTGPSRNFIVSKAKGKYIAFIDGDDLVSPNWLKKSLEILDNMDEACIVHPEATLTFGNGTENVLCMQKDMLSCEESILSLIGANLWCATCMTRKEVFEKVPYNKLGDGYGHEDYVFNIDTVRMGIKHSVAKNTVLFYRRTDSSRLSTANAYNAIIPDNDGFGFARIGDVLPKIHDILPKKTKKDILYGRYKKIRDTKFGANVITPIARIVRPVLTCNNKKPIPYFVEKELVDINHVETQLYPYPHVLRNIKHYSPSIFLNVGRSYVHLSRQFTHYPDYIFIVPWVVRGGADKVLLNYIKALKQINPNWHFTVITTLNVDNTWKDKLPDYVDLMEFGKMAYELPDEQKDVLFSRLITQLKCKKLHIINSEYGYEWVRRHKVLIGAEYKLYVSLFSSEFIPGSNMKGIYTFDDPYLFDIRNVVGGVFTDNYGFIEEMVERNGFPDSFFTVHYQPVQTSKMMQPRRGLRKPGKLHILWASRIVPTKLPDLVAKIGEKISVDKITIDVYGEFSSEIKSNIFNNIQSINYCGKFDGFDNIPTEKYDMLLYTSIDDGVPNILLEAAAAGLPIIASNDGGVGEFIVNNETGILIEDYLNPDSYVKKMEWAIDNFDNLANMAKNAQKKLLQQHSWDGFVDKVRRDIG